MHSSRRDFLKTSGIVGMGFLGLHTFVGGAWAHPVQEGVGYGPLLKDPKGLINLPKGFSYKIISQKGQTMSDGLLVPGKADGMATFPLDQDRLMIIRNHEISPNALPEGAYGKKYELLSKIDPKKFYDYGMGKEPALGGTTTLIYNERSQTVEKQYLSLAGTIRNCAGGPTPWGSWITCEENVEKRGERREKDHGFNFEVPAQETPQLFDPVPLKAMGRMNHEAVAVHPSTSIVYQTEDRHDGLIYRFIPDQPQQLSKGGKLQVLTIRDAKSMDTRNWLPKKQRLSVSEKLVVDWVDIDQVEAPEDDLRYRGFEEKGAARFARGEGMWMGEEEVYFACTNGGHKKKGQIFRYTPSPYEGQASREKETPGTLELFVEPNDVELISNCDNLTVAPWGDVVTCEDRSTPYVVGITPKGEFYRLAQNVGHQSEFAGGVFSPSGQTFFVNIQHAGLTLAITGPWKKA